MSFLSRLFGKKDDAPASLEDRLAKLEAQAESARPGHVGTPFNKAGDLALNHGDEARAAAYYGRAIDAFLEDGQREAARGVAQKIIRVRPTAVRTLCTLCWLDLAARHDATALLHLRDYVEAAKAVGRQDLAGSQIYEMAKLVPDSEFIGAAADALDQLDQSKLAADVRMWIRGGGSEEAIQDPAELADACLAAAIKSNERTSAPDLGGEEGGEPEVVEDTADEEASDDSEAEAAAEEPVAEEAESAGQAAPEEIAEAEPEAEDSAAAPDPSDESEAEVADEPVATLAAEVEDTEEEPEPEAAHDESADEEVEDVADEGADEEEAADEEVADEEVADEEGTDEQAAPDPEPAADLADEAAPADSKPAKKKKKKQPQDEDAAAAAKRKKRRKKKKKKKKKR